MLYTSLKHMQYSVKMRAVKATVSISRKMFLKKISEKSIMTAP